MKSLKNTLFLLLLSCASSSSVFSMAWEKPTIVSLSQLLDAKKQQSRNERNERRIYSKNQMELEIYEKLLAQCGENNIHAINFTEHLDWLDLSYAILPQVILIEGKRLQTIPSLIWGLTRLKKLSLKNNFLVSVSKQIENLRNLTHLTLSDNGLVSLPDEICQLTSLEVLDFSNNQLKTLPANIGNLKNLTYLDLRGNNLSENEKERIEKSFAPECQIIF